jgi:Flp pilus assembly protein TadD
LEQAQEEMRKREYPKALDTLRSAQVVAPNDPQVYELLSEAYDRSGDRQASREAREKARALAEKQAPPQ